MFETHVGWFHGCLAKLLIRNPHCRRPLQTPAKTGSVATVNCSDSHPIS